MILILLTIIGLTFFFKESTIFSSIRNYLMNQHHVFFELFQCPFCLGFWSALILFPFHQNAWYLFSGAILSFFAFLIFDYIQVRILKNES